MKLAASTVIVFVASFTLAAAQAPKIDVTKTAPPPASVNVLNFPETQSVTGTVSVENLPAVQTVGGTVIVGNLPLDAEGALRVSSAPASTGQLVWYELIDAPVDLCSLDPITVERSVNTDGYSMVSVRVVTTNNAALNFEPVWQFADGEEFLRVADARDGLVPCMGSASTRLVCRNIGGNVKVRVNGSISCSPYPPLLTSVRVYLFR
jgi:hypothetical protein